VAKTVVALAAVAVLATVGFGSDATSRRPFVEPIRITSTLRAVFLRSAPPGSRAPGIGPQSLFFFDSRVGFTATTGGGGYMPKVGWQRPLEVGRIQVTTDGGLSWRTRWSGEGIVFSSIAFSGRLDGVASGRDVHGFDPGKGGAPPVVPVVLATHDGGASWARVRAPFGDRLADVRPAGPRTWFAFAPKDWDERAPALRRTDDGGAGWKTVPLPAGAQAVRFTTPLLGFAGAAGAACPKLAQLWRTTDGGTTWEPLAGTCGPSYVDIDTRSPSLVFTAQGYSREESDTRRNVIRRSEDGGETWHVVLDDRKGSWPRLAQVTFSDRDHGWATSSESDQGFVWNAVHVTSDGGRTWPARHFPALPTAFVGNRYAWAGDQRAGYLWRTTDGARAWHVGARPDQTGAYELEFANRRSIAVSTGVGVAVSRDGGRAWTLRPRVLPREAARASGAFAYFDVDTDRYGLDTYRAYLSRNHGHAWTRLRLPRRIRYGVGDVSFADATHGLLASGQGDLGRVPVYSTRDGGRTWRRVRVPRQVVRDSEANLGPGLIVIPNALDPPRVNLAALSFDSGAHWLTFPLRADFWDCDGARPSPRTIWISCAQSVTKGSSILLISRDGGTSWRKLLAPAQLDEHLAVVGNDEAWAIGSPYGRSPGTIWHTVDGGRTWHEVWARIPPTARVFQFEKPPVIG
jgi:photosystem II stability/assembly factor-like uncharacterized protein